MVSLTYYTCFSLLGKLSRDYPALRLNLLKPNSVWCPTVINMLVLNFWEDFNLLSPIEGDGFVLPVIGDWNQVCSFFNQLSLMKDREDHIFWSEILGKALREAVTHHLLKEHPRPFFSAFHNKETTERMRSGNEKRYLWAHPQRKKKIRLNGWATEKKRETLNACSAEKMRRLNSRERKHIRSG